MKGNVFFRTTGNGNCLFNSCSLALKGDESLSVYLRCLTSIELFEHSEHYANHPIIFDEGRFGKLNENTIFSNLLSHAAFALFQKDERLSAANAEAAGVAVNIAFSSFLSLLAVSSVIEMPIESYYRHRGAGGAEGAIAPPHFCQSETLRYPTKSTR